MDLQMREAEGLLDGVAERGALERAPVVPAPLVPGERPDTDPLELPGEPDPVQDARRVRRDLNPGADLAQPARLLEDVHVETGIEQRERGAEATDPAPDDADPHAP